MNDVVELLEAFVNGTDRSIDWAKSTEAAIDGVADDGDPRFENLRDYLASYRPGGGDYLYGEAELIEVCQTSLAMLTQADR